MLSMNRCTTSSPSMPSRAAPSTSLVSASTSTFMKPCVSLRSWARPTRRIGRGVDIERIGGGAIRQAARVVVEQIAAGDFEVVVGGVGEGAVAVDVAERPDARDIGAQLVVDREIAAGIEGEAGLADVEVLDIGLAADGNEQVAGGDGQRLAAGGGGDGDGVAGPPGEAQMLDVEAEGDILVREDIGDCGRDLCIIV